MYCKHCGHEINDNAIICTNCGIATDKFQTKPATTQKKISGWAIAGITVGVCALMVGFIFLMILCSGD